MSELISPLLEGFSMGAAISDHHGIRCCPAIKENTDKKYIVKIIALPPTQRQMDALLLAGAYRDPSEAMEYFQSQGQQIMEEAALLKTLSKLEGFLSYEGWQMEPITRYRLGYEVYLVGSYKRTLDKYIRSHAVTHLEAINLGLDMSAALSVCRQAGAIYVNLKPSNIFMSEKKEYRIGDLGFIQLDALHYTTLPEKYQSPYTPPELFDPMASMNLTADTYALGMLLYQLYNDGNLPFKVKAPEGGLPSPIHADYELAEIIMKAIDPDPEKRYTDPADMGKALAAYLQRNSVNDVPITPLKISKRKLFKSKEEKAETPVEPASVPEETPEPVPEETPVPEEPPIAEPEEVISEEPIPEPEEIIEEVPEISEEPEVPDETELEDAEPEEELDEEPEEAAEAPQEVDELTQILAKADDLIAHELPGDMTLPEIVEEDPFAFAAEEESIDDVPLEPEEEPAPAAEEPKKVQQKFVDPKYKKRRKRLIKGIAALVLLGLMAAGARWYYLNLYLQTIRDLTIQGDQNQITVLVDSDTDESLLTVSCSNNFGYKETHPVQGGKATFTGLESNSMYTVQVEVSGFHTLTGETSGIFTTEANTNIVTFTSVAGPEDGSVILNFTVDGEDPQLWKVNYTAEGEEPQHKAFTGHTVTINQLSLGKTYTFSLEADGITLDGQTQLDVIATRLILAENLSVVSSSGSDMTVRWEAPGDVVVNSWDVRCYDHYAYDEKVTVTEPEAMFTGIDPTKEYIIEVTADRMTQPARTSITANPINVSNFAVDDSKNGKLNLTWDFTGEAPDGGWLLIYTVDGGENTVIKADKPTAAISSVIPGGNYTFTLEAADGTTIFNNILNYTAPEAKPYDANALTQDMLTVGLVKTPEDANWRCENLADTDYTDTFQVGDSISIGLRAKESFYLPGAQTQILYVVRDAYGNILLTAQQEIIWKQIWTGGDTKNGELTLPKVPGYPGEFVLDLYFDGMAVASIPFKLQ